MYQQPPSNYRQPGQFLPPPPLPKRYEIEKRILWLLHSFGEIVRLLILLSRPGPGSRSMSFLNREKNDMLYYREVRGIVPP
jgi:hypothetical protein